MWAKLLIVVTCLYVARASVPNIFDDEDVSNLAELTRTARSCSYSGCNSFCRKQGHARGVCIGTYCQCRFRRRRSLDEESVPDNAVESNEKAVKTNEEKLLGFDAVSGIRPATFVAIEGDESTKVVTVRSCGYAECNSFCRKLGYARGVCIGNYCQCRYRMAPLTPSAEFRQETAVEDAVEALDAVETGDKTPVASDVKSSDASDHGRVVRAARPCSSVGCTNHCRRLGHARGVCIGSYCQCRSRLARSTDLKEGAAVENAVDASDKTPTPTAEEETFVGIVIVKAKTFADNAARVDEDKLFETEGNTLEDNLITTTNGLVTDNEVNPEVFRARSEDCNLRWCEQNCRRIGFPGGACVNGHCKCDILRSAMPAVPAPFTEFGNTLEDNFITRTNGLVTEHEVNPELFGARLEDCNLRWCEQNCRRIGFPGGACVNGRCKCDILRSAMPAVAAPFTIFEDEEEIESRAARRCTASMCAQNCRRLGFRNSRCSGTRCICW